MLATHRPRGILWGISANSWRATEWPAWNASLGRLRAELDNGPKTKFASFLTLYISYLRNQVIRALDQQVIRPQTASVNTLIMVTEIRFRRSKLGQTQCNFLYALLHNITFNFYFSTNSSCLAKFGERGMSMSLFSQILDLE